MLEPKRLFSRAALIGAALLAIACLGAASAGAASLEDYGVESLKAESSTVQAGMHPDLTTEFVLNHQVEGGILRMAGSTERVSVALPPGMAGNPTNYPTCTVGELFAGGGAVACPLDSQVGIVRFQIENRPASTVFTEPLYNIAPPRPDVVARLGFVANATGPVFIDVGVRSGGDYGVSATVAGGNALSPLVSVKTTIWGDPADPSHDEERLTHGEALFGCQEICLPPPFGPAEGKRFSGLGPRPFLSNPVACQEANVGLAVTSYQLPGRVFRESAALEPIVGCESIGFSPSLRVEPTSHQAGAPTGLSAKLKIPQTNDMNLPATSPLKDAKVTLPEGMTISSAAADGLEGCSAAQVGYEAPKSIAAEEEDPPGSAHCPDASKIGTATFVSPDLSQPLHGSIYQRAPGEQPYLGAHEAGEATQLFGLWLVSDELGMHIKIPGVISADPSSGRLTTSFTETPQLPVEEIDLELKSGPRAPLRNPDSCGTYKSSFEFAPWSGNAPVSGQSQMEITEGCNAPGFAPALSSGVSNPVAGSYSPFSLTLKQESGEQNLSGLSVTLPPGLSAKLAGVGLCSDAQAATGDCPASSQVGTTTVATGPGPQPLWIPQPGKAPTAVYLAGAYRGAPYSLLVKVPAQAGPFDLGDVLTRVALDVDPRTAQVTAASDPLPQILQGVPVSYRTVHVDVNRSGFTLNPTSCEAMKIDATATSIAGAKASLSNRFQVGGCGELGFSPKLHTRLFGKTRRGAFPRLRAVYAPKAGDANLKRLLLRFPHSEFIEQAHFRTICTRVQYAANGGHGAGCPAGSVYGHIRVFTPLLSEPLEGPVYLRSSSHKLPDAVFALHGQIDAEVAVRIDSVHGGLRAIVQNAPDIPLTKAVVNMQGGQKGLFVNSRDICAGHYRATAKSTGQNGAASTFRPAMSNSRCGKSSHKKKHKKHKRARR